MNSKLNIPARVTVFTVLTLLVIAAALTLPKLSFGPVFAQAVAPPGQPTALTGLAVGTRTIELSWTAPEAVADPITGYRIDRSTDDGDTWVTANANTGNDKVYYSDTHNSLAGADVIYRVAGINDISMGQFSANSVAVTPPVAGAQPNAPTGLMATANGSTTINLSWTAPARGSSAITGYVLQWSEKGEQPWTDFTTQPTGTGTSTTDSASEGSASVAAGTTRHYRVAAVNGAGRGPYSGSISETTPPAGVPAPPEALTGLAVGTRTIELSWTASATDSPAVLGHRIERSTDNGDSWVVVAENTGNDKVYYSDTHGSLAGKTAIYRVAAINVIGKGPLSANSAVVTPPVAGSQPNAPTGLKATEDGSTTIINLSWTAPAVMGASAITGYTVQWSSDGEQPWVDIDAQPTATATTATDTVTAGTTRHYRVAAANSIGTGPYSGSVSETTPSANAPGQPTPAPTALAVGTQTIELSWTAPTGATISGYRIDRSTDNGANWVTANADTGNDKTYYSDTHSSLAGKTAIYRVAGINDLSIGQFSDESTAVTPPVAGVQPNAPTGLMATANGSTTINLSWTAPAARGASAITGYTVQWSSDGEQPWANVTTQPTAAATTTTDTVTEGTTRHYRVAATNSVGTGPYSGSVSETSPPAGVPEPPADLTALPVGTQTIELSWTASTTTNLPVLGHRIERSTDDGDSWVVVAEDTGNDKVYYSDTHDSLAGADVIYRVAAINILGKGPLSGNSDGVTPPTAGAQPNAPTGLTATADGPTTIKLSWTAPARGASAITGYIVQFSEEGEQPWTPVGDGDADSGNTPHTGTTTTYDHTITAGATNHYRVAATNMVGTGPYSTPTTLGPADQMGMVALSTQEPVVGTAIIATLTDDDGMVTGEMWQWQKSMDKNSWMATTGTGAMTRSYTPEAMDEGYYLRATVTYTDKNRSDRMAYSDATTGTVMLPADQMGTVTLSTQEPLVGEAITATLADDDGMVTGQVWQWQKSMDKTSWMDAMGMGAMTNSYTPEMADVGYHLRATVTYTDKYRSGRMADSMPTDSMVVDNNAPVFADGPMTTREVPENSAAETAVGSPLEATDADAGDTLTYALSGMEAMYFTIDDMGQIKVGMGTMLDYETKARYSVTVTATDDSGASNNMDSIDVTINVTNVDEDGVLTLSPMKPVVGTELTATLMDPDGFMEDDVDWQWSRSPTLTEPFIHIAAESMSYTPTAEDADYYLQVAAKYTDGHGPDKEAEKQADGMVRTALMAKYDTNEDGWIDRDEALDALRDYRNDEITRDEALDVLRLYRLYRDR